jgi:hypothetical protein
VRINSGIYVLIFFLAIVLLPLYSDSRKTSLIPWIISATNIAILFLAWLYNSGPYISLVHGMNIICGRFMSGCANITIFYIWFVLLFAYSFAVGNAILGIFQGKNRSIDRWEFFVANFLPHSPQEQTGSPT